MKKSKSYCSDCGQPKSCHIHTWMEELLDCVFPSFKLSRRVEVFFDILIEKVFIFFKLAKFTTAFTSSDIQLRTWCFLEEMKKRGAMCFATKTKFGFTNYFKMKIGNKLFRFETLPQAKFASKYGMKLVDDKELAKEHCKKGGFPVAPGQAFWFWQKKQAMSFGYKIGFPLVVKPRNGSVSRHVTTDIQNNEQLEKAINHSIGYSPVFIIEKFMVNTSVFRATVIDFDFVVCVQQVPANIIGNGTSSIRELIDQKNNDPLRGETHQKEITLYKIAENEVTKKILETKGYSEEAVLLKDEILYLQKDPFLKLGGDLIEVTPKVHPDNLQMFKDLARFFDIRITGIDFLAHNISVSWKNQSCAILELNSAPCIELHQFPSIGTPTNSARALADMFFKYYL